MLTLDLVPFLIALLCLRVEPLFLNFDAMGQDELCLVISELSSNLRRS